MSRKNNIIEVNGKQYDAVTGKLLSSTISPKKPTGVVMDGIARKKSRPTTPTSTAHTIHKSPQRSKTLMRTAVKKPVSKSRPVVHAQSGIVDGFQKVRAQASTPKHAEPVSRSRQNRAQEVSKSSLISKFGYGSSRAVTPKLDVLPVKETPAHAAAPIESSFHNVVQHAVNPLQHAIEMATSHTQPKTKKPRMHHKLAHKLNVKPNFVSAGAATLGVLLISGFFAYQNVPNLAMRVATAKAGVHGALPGYKPSGFSMSGPIQFNPGQITISYKSNSDDREFKVTQRTTEWNSETLLQNYVAVDRRPYQSYQENDKTIYIYDGTNATWVEGGVWYQIEGNSSLSSDQLLRMANSL